MEYEIKDLSPTQKAISFKFPKEEVEKEKEEIVKKFKKNAKLPGFRPGKVPPELIKARFKKEIEEEILGSLTEKNFEGIIKEKKWKIVGEIFFSEKNYEEEFFKSEVRFFIIPEINLPPLEDLELKKEEIFVEDWEVEEEIENFIKSKGNLIDVEGPIKEDYYALCQLKGTYENEDREMDFGFIYLSPTGKDPVPELLGKNKKDEIFFSKDFPPDDPSPHRGKKVNFKGIIEEIKILKYPDLNIEIIKENFPEINSIEEFKEMIKKRIFEEKKKNMEKNLKKDLINQLLKKTEIPVPEPLLESEIRGYLNKVALALYERKYDLNSLDWNKISKEYEPEAIKNIQKNLLLLSFAEKYGIDVKDEEVLDYVRKFCKEKNLDYEKTIKEYRENGYLENIKEELKKEKTLSKILENLSLQI